MVTVRILIARVIFGVLAIILITNNYTSLLHEFLGESPNESRSSRNAPNPGYGDTSTDIDIDADIEADQIENLKSPLTAYSLTSKIKNACLPKLVCELNAIQEKNKLTDADKSLLAVIRDTSLTSVAALTKYHFAAHMGQLISGIDGTGCHTFYPSCPIPGLQVLRLLKKVRLR